MSLGIGIASGTPDYIKAFGSKKEPQVVYSLYNKEKKLTDRQVVKWNSKVKLIEGLAHEDGFLQVSFINGSRKVERAGDMDIKLKPKEKVKDKDAVSNSYTNPDEPPADAVIQITVDGIEISFYDRNNNGEIDGYSYSDANGVVVGNVAEYGVYNSNSMGEVVQNFYPPQWNDLGEFLDWYVYYGGVEQPTINPCDQVAVNSGTTATNLYTTIQSTIAQFFPFYFSTPPQNEQYFLVNGGATTPIAELGQEGGEPQGTNSSTTIIVHTHPDGAEGDLPSPSLNDLFALDGIGSQFQASYVIAYDGTKYAMVVNDYDKLQTFIDNNQNLFNSNGTINTTGNDYGQAYGEAYVSFTGAGLSDAEAHERARAYVMNDAGVTLTKAPAGSNIFTKIGASPKRDSNGNIVKDADNLMIFEKSDCPR